ncbi:MAG: hypothetical protein Q7J86_06940 [Bacteroidota bacterium]|nr:hypothetical protein [Bacteroidota bacterium]
MIIFVFLILATLQSLPDGAEDFLSTCFPYGKFLNRPLQLLRERFANHSPEVELPVLNLAPRYRAIKFGTPAFASRISNHPEFQCFGNFTKGLHIKHVKFNAQKKMATSGIRVLSLNLLNPTSPKIRCNAKSWPTEQWPLTGMHLPGELLFKNLLP